MKDEKQSILQKNKCDIESININLGGLFSTRSIDFKHYNKIQNKYKYFLYGIDHDKIIFLLEMGEQESATKHIQQKVLLFETRISLIETKVIQNSKGVFVKLLFLYNEEKLGYVYQINI